MNEFKKRRWCPVSFSTGAITLYTGYSTTPHKCRNVSPTACTSLYSECNNVYIMCDGYVARGRKVEYITKLCMKTAEFLGIKFTKVSNRFDVLLTNIVCHACYLFVLRNKLHAFVKFRNCFFLFHFIQ